MQQRFWGVSALVLSIIFAVGSQPTFADPVAGAAPAHLSVLEFEATRSDSDTKLSLQIAEATDPEQIAALETMARNAIEQAAAQGAKTVVIGIPPEGGGDILGTDTSVEDLALRVADAKDAEVIIAEQKELKKTKVHNLVLTVIRTVGIAAGIAYTVQITQDCSFFDALPVGLIAASMSAKLQLINRTFQGWIASAGFFRVNEGRPGDVPSSHKVMYGKLALTNLVYLGAMRAAIHALGLEHAYEYLSVTNAANLMVAATSGSLLEYVWDRYISESRNQRLADDPDRLYHHLRTADQQAAGLSVLGTISQALSSAGWSVGTIATGVIVATGVTRLWVFKIPDSLPAKIGSFVRRQAGGSCAYLATLFAIQRGP